MKNGSSWEEEIEPLAVCGKKCDHGSECLLMIDHKPSDRHETQHGCIFYDILPKEKKDVKTMNFIVMDRYYALVLDHFKADTLESAQSIVETNYATYIKANNLATMRKSCCSWSKDALPRDLLGRGIKMSAYRENALIKPEETLGEELRRINGSAISDEIVREIYDALLNELRIASREGYTKYSFRKEMSAIGTWCLSFAQDKKMMSLRFGAVWEKVSVLFSKDKGISIQEDGSHVHIRWD